MKSVWLFIGMGSVVGSIIPMFFGAGYTSIWAIIGGMVGSFGGIWVYRYLDLD